jgi:hypothetical protein
MTPDNHVLARRRRFLQMSGLALLGGTASVVESALHSGGANVTASYFAGLVANPELEGPAGDLILNVYLAIDPDGLGFGILADPLHGAVNSHLEVLSASRQGNAREYKGAIILSNTPEWIGAPFEVTAVVQNALTALLFKFNGQVFSGKGLFADGTSNIVRFADGSVR